MPSLSSAATATGVASNLWQIASSLFDRGVDTSSRSHVGEQEAIRRRLDVGAGGEERGATPVAPGVALPRSIGDLLAG